MKKLYVVYECDTHRSYSSYVIKLVTANKDIAKTLFNENKKSYKNSDYSLNVSEYQPNLNSKCDNNFIQEFETPFLTTDKDEQ